MKQALFSTSSRALRWHSNEGIQHQQYKQYNLFKGQNAPPLVALLAMALCTSVTPTPATSMPVTSMIPIATECNLTALTSEPDGELHNKDENGVSFKDSQNLRLNALLSRGKLS